MYLSEEGAFEATAEAIRSKLNTNELLLWDATTGFASDVARIPHGGGEAIDCYVREIYQRCDAQLPLELAMSEQITHT